MTKPTHEELAQRVKELEEISAGHKQIIKALLNNEEKYRLLYEQAPMGYQALDENGHFLEVNQAWLDALGYTRDEVLGKSFGDFLDPDWQDHFKKNFPRFKTIGEILGIEFEMVKKDGSSILVSINGKISTHLDGTFKQTHCILHDVTQQRIMEDQLRDSEQMFQAIFDTAVDGILLADIESKKFISGNRAICEMLGYSQDEILELSVNDIHPQEDLDRVIEAFTNQAQNNITTPCEFPVKRKDGTLFYADINSSPLRLKEKEYLLGIFRDITDRKKTELSLVAEKNMAKKYLDVAAVMLAALNPAGKITLINQKGCEILHVTEDEALGKNWFENYLPEKMVDKVREVFTQVMSGGVKPVEYYENPVLTADGIEKIIAFHNTVIHDEKGDITGIIFSGEDITKRKKDHDELRRWWQVFEHAEWGIAIGSADKETFDLINPAYARMHGYSLKELLAQKIAAVFAPDMRAELPGIMQKCQDLGHYTFEADHICKDNTVFPVYHDVTSVKDEQGQVLYHIANIQDITERKQAEEEKRRLETQLLQAYKMEAIGTMAGGIAHDFNNILSIIIGYASIIQDSSPEGSPVLESINEVRIAADRAKNLVKQILAFSRQAQQELIPMKLQSIARETIKLLRSTIPTTIKIVSDINPQCGVVEADPTQINQIIMNLCTNAVHAMDEKGVLTITLQEVDLDADAIKHRPEMIPGPFVQLSVADTGTGMDAKIISRIFDPFFTTKEIGKGTGMGLSVVHGIVANHKGMITVKSEAGQGTTFHVFFPKIEKEAVKPFNTLLPMPTGKERILVVDDEHMITDIVSRTLKGQGYHVTAETISTKALETFKSNPTTFDLVITDQSMPEMSGAELSAEILKIRPDMPIILCTGYSSKISAEEARIMGISEFMSKPVNREKLVATVREVLDAR